MQLDYYSIQAKAIQLGIIKVSDIDGSHSYNCSMDKLVKLVLESNNNVKDKLPFTS